MVLHRSPDLVARPRSLADVPIERDSIGAMRMGLESPWPINWYVYRGTGVDQFPETYEPKPKPKPRPKQPRKPRPRRKPLDIQDTSTWGNWRRPPPPEPRVRKKPGGVHYIKRPPPPEPKPRRLRPAPGWQPLQGADIDALLDTIGE